MKSQRTPIYNYEEMQEVRDFYKTRELYYGLFIIVALVVGYVIGLMY